MTGVFGVQMKHGIPDTRAVRSLFEDKFGSRSCQSQPKLFGYPAKPSGLSNAAYQECEMTVGNSVEEVDGISIDDHSFIL